jgi:hypothetical protein
MVPKPCDRAAQRARIRAEQFGEDPTVLRDGPSDTGTGRGGHGLEVSRRCKSTYRKSDFGFWKDRTYRTGRMSAERDRPVAAGRRTFLQWRTIR